MGSAAIGGLADKQSVSLDDLSNTVLAIDAYIVIHQFIHSITDEYGDYLTNDDGFPISHLIGVISRTGPLLRRNIRPVYVFDGGYPDLKQEEVDSRSFPEAEDKFIEAKLNNDKEAARRYAHQKAHVTDSMVYSLQQLLQSMGLPYVDAPGEAEPQCVQLVHDGQADYPASQDWDTMLYGPPAMVRDLRSNGASMVHLQDMLDKREWTIDQLRWYAILRGTDYNYSVNGVGPIRGKEIVDQSDSFNEVMNRAGSYGPINRDRWRRVLDLIENPEVDTDVELIWGEFNLDHVTYMACEVYGLEEAQVTNRLRNCTITS